MLAAVSIDLCQPFPLPVPPTHTSPPGVAPLPLLLGPQCVIHDSFLGPAELANVYAATLLNVHPPT